MPPDEKRKKRAVVMLTIGEYAALKRLAVGAKVPLGTMLYELVRRRLR